MRLSRAAAGLRGHCRRYRPHSPCVARSWPASWPCWLRLRLTGRVRSWPFYREKSDLHFSGLLVFALFVGRAGARQLDEESRADLWLTLHGDIALVAFNDGVYDR